MLRTRSVTINSLSQKLLFLQSVTKHDLAHHIRGQSISHAYRGIVKAELLDLFRAKMSSQAIIKR